MDKTNKQVALIVIIIVFLFIFLAGYLYMGYINAKNDTDKDPNSDNVDQITAVNSEEEVKKVGSNYKDRVSEGIYKDQELKFLAVKEVAKNHNFEFTLDDAIDFFNREAKNEESLLEPSVGTSSITESISYVGPDSYAFMNIEYFLVQNLLEKELNNYIASQDWGDLIDENSILAYESLGLTREAAEKTAIEEQARLTLTDELYTEITETQDTLFSKFHSEK